MIFKQDFDKMHIYDLRKFGNDIGVKSPTSLKKDELIQEILDIENGVKKPCEEKTMGRPTMLRMNDQFDFEKENKQK